MATKPKRPARPGRLKNPAAVSLGRRGGRKGGPARAKKLSPQRRKAIARMGGYAKARKQRGTV